ncbi:cytochrome c peroxidase [Aquidulcibacter sp.]|uniref:cytochrome c peroxidase n=1 Tax=Aquidulcibacter sp. TaxID=2052990 RepID=UPI0025B9A7EF|nr:cytochrome c peroxidase [Aquidulcibacter sp.]MCA3693882.1 fibronectin type III domain-containing protein [Aquidulcibacter sp.]
MPSFKFSSPLFSFLALASLAALAACGGGGGSDTGSSGTGVTLTAPGAPTLVALDPGNTAIKVHFTPPSATGGSAISSYTASCAAGGATRTGSGSTSPIDVTGLTNGTAYSCSIAATNATGTGASSTPASATPNLPVVPAAPTIGTATPADKGGSIAFTAPLITGGSPITGYSVSCVSGTLSVTATGSTSPATVTGLSNGLTYSCSVRAVNAVGAGAASNAVNLVPNGAIATPAGVAEFTSIDFNALDNFASISLPAYYDGTVTPDDNTPNNNAIANRAASLGRVLFYDRRLSVNDTISCASCHRQANGFSDPRQFSTGFSGTAFTTAHAMRLGNISYYRPGTMFWDKRAASVEAQATQPIQNAVEMGWDTAAGGIGALITKMAATSYYPDLFNFAFGSSTITEARIQQALAQFERAMVSTGSKWDTGYATVFSPTGPNRNLGVDLPNFTAQENRGRTLYFTPPNQGGAGCAACHNAPTFALAPNSLSNGLDAGETRIFKSPSLKNMGVGGPYMHDGRFTTLEQVVEHYNSGVQAGPALDNRLQRNGVPQRLNLSVADKAALAAFLRTLDDTALLTDPKFASPMRK